MGLGIILIVAFPKKAVSLPTQYEEFASLQPDYEGSERLYQEWKAEQAAKKAAEQAAKKVKEEDLCSCVLFAKRLTGFNQPVGYAKNWPRNTDKPVVGGVVITNESSSGSFNTGHVAYITQVNGDSFKVIEGNYVRCKVSTRTIKVGDKKIIGYWSPI